MPSFLTFLALSAVVAWLIIFLLPWQPWRNRDVLEKLVELQNKSPDLQDVTVVIPARNEAVIIGNTLAALALQGTGLQVILVDDCSSDGYSRNRPPDPWSFSYHRKR